MRRCKNLKQREAYEDLLVAIMERADDKDQELTVEELKMINLIKIVLEAGWCLDQESFQQLLKFCGVYQSLSLFKKWQDEKQQIELRRELIVQTQRQMYLQKIAGKCQKELEEVPKPFDYQHFLPIYLEAMMEGKKVEIQPKPLINKRPWMYVDQKLIEMESKLEPIS